MKPADRIIYWAPRILGIILVLFTALFALDTQRTGSTFDFITNLYSHLLFPAVLLATLIAAWHREIIGIITYTALGILYTFMAYSHLSWVLVIAGPMFLCAALFALSRYKCLHITD